MAGIPDIVLNFPKGESTQVTPSQDNRVGSVPVTMLNICSAVEAELQNVIANKQNTVLGASKSSHYVVDAGESYTFGPITMPDLLKDSFFGILSFVHSKDDQGEYYVVAIDIREQTGETFCNYESKLDKTVFDLAAKVHETVTGGGK